MVSKAISNNLGRVCKLNWVRVTAWSCFDISLDTHAIGVFKNAARYLLPKEFFIRIQHHRAASVFAG